MRQNENTDRRRQIRGLSCCIDMGNEVVRSQLAFTDDLFQAIPKRCSKLTLVRWPRATTPRFITDDLSRDSIAAPSDT
jgi:hypothetical protein